MAQARKDVECAMPALRRRIAILGFFIAALLLPLLLLSACGQNSGGQTGNDVSGSGSQEGTSGLTHIAVRNSSDDGGLAWTVGRALMGKGYVYSNNYTVDIGNIRYPIKIGNSSFQSTKSFILIPENNEPLKAEAQKLQEILGFSIKEDTRLIALIIRGPYDGPSNTVFVILGSDDAWSLLSEFSDPPDNIYLLNNHIFVYSDVTSVAQIEPGLYLG